MSFRLSRIATFCVAVGSAGCLQITEPGRPLSASTSAARSEAPAASARPQEVRVSGAFRHGEFVITVHGYPLEPNHFVRAIYELDGEPVWPAGANVGMDFYTSLDRRLWELVEPDGEDTGAAAQIKKTGDGFTFSVPLEALHDPRGPIQYGIQVFNGTPGFWKYGRTECKQCQARTIQ